MKFISKITIILIFLNYSVYGSEYKNTFNNFYKQNSFSVNVAAFSTLGTLACVAYGTLKNDPWQSSFFKASLLASAVGLLTSSSYLLHSYINKKQTSLRTTSEFNLKKAEENSISPSQSSNHSYKFDNEHSITGFKNGHYRCYLNSTLQLLLQIRPFDDDIKDLLGEQKKACLTINTDRIYEKIDKELQQQEGGRLGIQRDATSALQLVLEKINNTECLKTSYFKEEQKRSSSATCFMCLPIVYERQNGNEEMECLDKALKTYLTVYDDKNINDKITRKIDKIGKFFIVALNRFVYDENNNSTKINHLVNVPSEINLTSYLTDQLGQKEYSLRAVVVHYGTLNQGHYMTYVRNNDMWICCNDEKVTKVDESEAFEQINNNGYIVLYEEK